MEMKRQRKLKRGAKRGRNRLKKKRRRELGYVWTYWPRMAGPWVFDEKLVWF